MGQTFNASSIDPAVTTPAGLGTISKDALLTLQSQFSGASLPATNLVGGMVSLDTTNNVYWRRDPANTKWMLHKSAADALVVAKSGAYTAVLGDFEKTLNCSGTWSLSLTAAATLTDGWWMRVVNSGSGTITIDPNASETINGAATLALYPGEDGFIVCDGAGFRMSRQAPLTGATFTGDVNGTNFPMTQEFRLTLTSGVPVTTSDVATATTIYCTPYKGNRIALYTGSAWVTRTSAEFSLALGTLTADLPYDVFCYDNAGTPTLEFLAWASETARATALSYQDGVLVKSGAATRRYLGSFRTISTTQTCDMEAHSGLTTGRYLWNYYHRVRRSCKAIDPTASWTYSTATYRQANNSAVNQLNVLAGVAEDSVLVIAQSQVINSTATKRYAHSGIGVNSTTVNSAITQSRVNFDDSAAAHPIAQLVAPALLGRNSYMRLELAQGTDVQTWIGSGASPLMQTAIFGEVMA